MFLIAGLLGMVVSGVMMMAPLPVEEDEAMGPDDQAEGPDTFSDGVSQAVAESPPAVSPQTMAEASGSVTDGPVADLLPGHYISDAVNGSDMSAIQHQADPIFGGATNEAIAGHDGSDLILGNDGDDALTGHGGRDELIGGRGGDTLSGHDGDDILWGDDGEDRLDGGDGNDLLVGGDGDDMLVGDDGDDRLFGQGGADMLIGGAGDDILDGSEVEPGPGGQGDMLHGGDGDDTLAGAAGDVLEGGEGADSYLFRAPSAGAFLSAEAALDAPVITDFDLAEDRIEIALDGAPFDTSSIKIEADEAGAKITVDGIVVARVAGVQGITLDHVNLIHAA
ncbi:MAG: calcium-binding protein [Pseudomonadota bacterium]